jgi:DNA polymerase elongation subunit (family B)
VPHTFAWGGIHGAIPKYFGKGRFINMDVRSYYPSLMIEYDFLSRNVLSPEKFKQIYWDRIAFKASKDPRQLPYKIVLNGTYGAMKDKFNNLYDPKQANNVCINGQLLLLDLMERLEDYCAKSSSLIQMVS